MKKQASTASLLRKAVQDLSRQRLQPPPGTPDAQCIVWHDVVDNLPSDWFAREQSALLAAYCNHVVRLAKIEAALHELDPVQDIETFDKLTRLAAGESSKVLSHARSMRLTQQSRLKAETASGRAEAAAMAADSNGDAASEFFQ